MLFNVLTLLAALSTLSGVLASPHPALAARGSLQHGKIGSKHDIRSSPKGTPSREHAPASFTNAQRLSRGTSPNPPTRRSSARRAQSSASFSPATRGYIQVLSVDDNGNPTSEILGYVSKTTSARVQYRVDPSLDSALLVSSSGDHNLVPLNSDISSPNFLGLVQSGEATSPDPATGGSNYWYLASTEQTSPGATPQNVRSSVNTLPGRSLPAESAVWSVDASTGRLTAQWINYDGSAAPTIAIIHDSNVLFTTGQTQEQRVELVFMSM